MQAHQLFCLRAKEAEMEEAVSTEKAAREAAEAAKAAAKAELAACEKEEKEVKAKRAKAQGAGGEFKKLEEAEKKAAEALVKEETAFTEAQKSHKADEARVKALEKAEADSKAAAAKLGADQEKAAAEAAAAAEVEAAAAEVEAKAKASYEAEMGLGSENSDGPKNLQGQLSAASAAVKEHEAAAKAAKMQGDHAAKELKGAEKALADARKKGGKGEAELEKLAKEVRTGTRLARTAPRTHGPRLLLTTPPLPRQVAALRAKAGDGETYDEAALAKEEAGLAKASAKAAAAVEGLTNGLASFDFKYADPEKNFDRSRVVGTVASNFTMADAEGTHAVALEAVAGAKLKQVIVDNEKTAMLVLQKGKLQRRVAMVPLSKIEPTTIAAAKVAQAKALVGESRAFLATELIEFAPSVAKAMDYAFGNTIVCADAKAAKKVRARPQYWVTPLTHTPHTPHPPVPPLTPHIPRYRCARSSASAR